MRPTAALFLFVVSPLFAVAATPAVNSGTINYSTNQITLTGSGFQPNKAKPTVAFNGIALTISTVSNTQVVATLPTGLTPGTFDLTVTNSQGNSVDFNMTYGATGPQGPAGPAGPTGPQGQQVYPEQPGRLARPVPVALLERPEHLDLGARSGRLLYRHSTI